MLKHLIKRAYLTLSKNFINTILMEGYLKGSDQPFRCLVADNSQYHEYLSSKIYATAPNVISRRKIWAPTLRKMVENSLQDLDLCIAVLRSRNESQLRDLYDFKGRKLVRQIIDTSGPWEEIKGRFRKVKKNFSNRMARSSQYYRISNEMNDFDLFYHRMYLPHVNKQFGKLSIVNSYQAMKRMFLKGLLLFLMNGNESIAGLLCVVVGQRLMLKGIGVLDGDEKYIKAEAQAALYYFAIQFAKENNLREVDFVMSAALLKDGVYQHKRAWGAAVYPDDNSDTWVYFIIPDHSEKIVRFFEHNPVIIHSEQGLKGVVGLSDGTELSSERKKKLLDNFYAPGLEGLILLTSHSNAPLELSWNDLRENSHTVKTSRSRVESAGPF